MPNPVAWNLRLAVREGRLEAARALMEEMIASTRDEASALGFEWYLDEDGGVCHIRERYANSAAVMEHLGNFGTHFSGRFLECFEPTEMTVYGDPPAEARAVLDGFGARYIGEWGGFHR
jgi:quinol monooxygenase YgiN